MRKIKVSIDGMLNEDTEIYEAYTDDRLSVSSIALIKEEAVKFLDSSPYDYRFMEQGGAPFLRVYRGERFEDIPLTPISADDGEIFEGYYLEGFDLVEIE